MARLIAFVRFTCRKCGHRWYPRTPRRPKICPRCKQPWFQPRIYRRRLRHVPRTRAERLRIQALYPPEVSRQ